MSAYHLDAGIAELERLRTMPVLRGYYLLPASLGTLYAQVDDSSRGRDPGRAEGLW